MSHGDATKVLPDNFKSIASTDNSPYAAICSNNLYGVQFHPEVTHTQDGIKILKNFLYEIYSQAPQFFQQNPDVPLPRKIRLN